MRLASRLLPLTLAALALTAAPTGAQDEEQPIACTEEAVRAAVAAGGSYVFQCIDTVVLNEEIVVTKDVSFRTELQPGFTLRMIPTFGHRMFRVNGGTLTLEGLTLSGGGSELTQPLIGCNGAPGTAGCDGANGGPGQAGGDGGAGTDAEPSQGACFYVAAGAALVIRNDSVEKCIARGGDGMYGGDGGFGSNGEHGDDAEFQGAGVATDGGSGGSGSRGGNGGNAGDGGNAQGGAIYSLGTLTVVNSTFKDNLALGGRGGHGGKGGLAGDSGSGGRGGEGGAGGSGGSCGSAVGGNGGRGGDSGDAAGGAIYNAGKLTVAGTTFTGNKAIGAGAGGDYVVGSQTPTSVYALGGFGGGGCGGGDGVGGSTYGPDPPRPVDGSGGAGANGGNGGNIGDGGDGLGGAIFNTGQMDPPAGLTFSGNAVEGGRGWNHCVPQTVPDGDPQCPAGQAGRGGAGGQHGNGDYPDWHPWYEPRAYAPSGSPGQHGRGGADGVAADPDVRTVVVPPPTPKFISADVAGKLYTVAFDAGESTPGEGTQLAAWTWRFGDGTSGTGEQAERKYKKPGIYKVTLTVRDAIGQEAAITKDVEVKPQLDVTLKAKPSRIEVEQTKKGPKPVKVLLNVTVKNPNPVKLTDVKLPKRVEISLPDEPDATKKALSQKRPPMKKVGKKNVPDLEIGTLKKGESETRTYELVLKGDGAYVVEALVTGAGPSKRTVKGIGKTKVEGSTPLLFFAAEMGPRVKSSKDRRLTKSGTAFVIRVKLQNRSYTKKLLIYPIYAELSGNASDGHMQEKGLNVTEFKTKGLKKEVKPSPFVELAPRVKREFDVVVRTAGANAWVRQPEFTGGVGGTRAKVEFSKPKVGTVSPTKTVTRVPRDKVLMGEDSDEFLIHLDDSAPDREQFDSWEAATHVSIGIVNGLWNVTWGTIRGVLWDIPVLATTTLLSIPPRSLYYMHHQIELWNTVKGDPVLRAQFINDVLERTAVAFENAPYMLPSQKIADLYGAIDAAVAAKYTEMNNNWFAGDWRGAAEAMGTEGTERFVDVATLVGPSILARSTRVREALEAGKTAAYSAAAEALAPLTQRAIVSAEQAAAALRRIVKPGMRFTTRHLQKLYGLSVKESDWLLDFTFRHRVSVVLRSRLEESLKWISQGAVLKPYWIKLKNVNWADVEYLGYHADDVGRLIIKSPPDWEFVADRLRRANVKKGTPAYTEIEKRWNTRVKEAKSQERKDMFKWNADGEVEGKWPWQENGVDPHVQLDETATAGFRLEPTGRPGEFAVQIKKPGSGEPGVWGSVTGDVDLIAITAADGRALSDLEHVRLLKEIREGPMGALHPESATWVQDGKFWFKAKEDYLRNDGECCLAQFGPDGKARAVNFNADLSEFENRGKHDYRAYFDGQYQPPPSYQGRVFAPGT